MTRHSLILFLGMFATAHAQVAVPPAPVVVVGKAELMNSVRSSLVKEGDSFFLRTVEPWQQGDCTLPANTTLKGEITTLSVSGVGARHVVLTFQFAPTACAGSKSMLVTPLLVAVRVAPEGDTSDLKHYATTPTVNHVLQGIFAPPPPGERPEVASNPNNAITASYVGCDSESRDLSA